MTDKKLFAFRVAKPAEPVMLEGIGPIYDPQTQTSVWQGGSRPFAVRCSSTMNGRDCNAYGSYCTTYGTVRQYGYKCD